MLTKTNVMRDRIKVIPRIMIGRIFIIPRIATMMPAGIMLQRITRNRTIKAPIYLIHPILPIIVLIFPISHASRSDPVLANLTTPINPARGETNEKIIRGMRINPARIYIINVVSGHCNLPIRIRPRSKNVGNKIISEIIIKAMAYPVKMISIFIPSMKSFTYSSGSGAGVIPFITLTRYPIPNGKIIVQTARIGNRDQLAVSPSQVYFNDSRAIDNICTAI
jgi:hypothetical protein